MFITDFYKIISETKEDNSYACNVFFLSEANVCKEHLSTNLIVPNLCNIQLITECATKAIGKNAFLENISKCRFLSVIQPSNDKIYQVMTKCISTGPLVWNVVSQILYNNVLCIDFTGEIKEYGYV